MHISFHHSSGSRRASRIHTLAAAALLLSTVAAPLASAQVTPYTDVTAGAYYEGAAAALLDLHALDAGQTKFRPSDLATRAEIVKLLVNLNGNQLLYPPRSSFDDVSRQAWYFPYFEAAATAGWVHGDRDCYNQFHPCTARPPDPLNRAEAAALLVRAFALEHRGTAPSFPDVSQGQWYSTSIQTAADHCVLQGDDATGRVRPAAYMNRAEMVVMFYRAYQHLTYGTDCGAGSIQINQVVPSTSTVVRVSFTGDVAASRAGDPSSYTVARVSNGATVGVQSAHVLDSRTVELTLTGDLQAETSYVLTAHSLLSSAGAVFSDSMSFTFHAVMGHVLSATVLSGQSVRLTFNADLDPTRAREAVRYAVARTSGTGSISVQSATLVDSRTVDVQLQSALAANVSYQATVTNMLTSAGVLFSDSATFVLPMPSGRLTNVVAQSATRLRLSFDTDLDSARAQQTIRYAVSDGSRSLSVSSADLLVDKRTVDLTLGDTMNTQRVHTVNVQNMLTSQGVLFNASGSVVFDTGPINFKANLTGLQQVPPAITTASGTGSFTLTSGGLQYDVTVRNLSGSITAAHFHLGAAGINGPILMPISFTGSRATGTWTSLTNDQRTALFNGGIYVNVHTALYPNGEIRGQVLAQ